MCVVILKQILKKSKVAINIYSVANRLCFRVLYAASPVSASKYIYKKTTRKTLNLKNPKNFNEKLQWLKLYWQHPLVIQSADKYGMYEYVKSNGDEKILNELYAVYNKSSEIDWDRLPDKFALKCTHGCGYNIICDNKKSLDKNESLKKINVWMNQKFGKVAGEPHYDKMSPRIIVEKYIETNSGLFPNDYKIYCFDGKAKLVLVCSDRESGLKLNFLDMDWNELDIGISGMTSETKPEKPNCFNQMVDHAERLSKPFPFVRMDFYDYNGTPILGEMSFTPAGCMATYYNEDGLNMLGDMLVLPKEKVM